MSPTFSTLMLVAVTLVSLPARSAHACKPVDCAIAKVFPASGDVPADRFVLSFEPSRPWPPVDAATPAPRLTRVDGEARIDVPFDLTPGPAGALTLTPRDQLPVGTRLELDTDPPNCAQRPALHAVFTLTAPTPTPVGALGNLSATQTRGPLEVSDVSGTCGTEVDASYADLTVALAPALQPLASLLRYELVIDGAVNPGFSPNLGVRKFEGTNPKRFYAACSLPDPRFKAVGDVTPARHQVALRATLPDGTRFDAPAIDVDLICAATDTALASDASVENALASDAGIEPVETNDGCALASSHGSSWLAALALLMLRRKRA